MVDHDTVGALTSYSKLRLRSFLAAQSAGQRKAKMPHSWLHLGRMSYGESQPQCALRHIPSSTGAPDESGSPVSIRRLQVLAGRFAEPATSRPLLPCSIPGNGSRSVASTLLSFWASESRQWQSAQTRLSTSASSRGAVSFSFPRYFAA